MYQVLYLPFGLDHGIYNSVAFRIGACQRRLESGEWLLVSRWSLRPNDQNSSCRRDRALKWADMTQYDSCWVIWLHLFQAIYELIWQAGLLWGIKSGLMTRLYAYRSKSRPLIELIERWCECELLTLDRIPLLNTLGPTVILSLGVQTKFLWLGRWETVCISITNESVVAAE